MTMTSDPDTGTWVYQPSDPIDEGVTVRIDFRPDDGDPQTFWCQLPGLLTLGVLQEVSSGPDAQDSVFVLRARSRPDHDAHDQRLTFRASRTTLTSLGRGGRGLQSPAPAAATAGRPEEGR